MADSYLVGEQTKQKIFKESRKLFYKKGFVETTYNDISTAANINRALIPYHFNSKQTLGYAVYAKILSDFDTAFFNTVHEDECPPDLMNVLHTFAYYQMFDNAKLLRFAYEIISCEKTNDPFPMFEKGQIAGIGSKASGFTDTELEALANINSGMEKEIIRMLYESSETVDINTLARMELNMMMGYAGYSKKKQEELIDIAAELSTQLSVNVKNGFAVDISWNG